MEVKEFTYADSSSNHQFSDSNKFSDKSDQNTQEIHPKNQRISLQNLKQQVNQFLGLLQKKLHQNSSSFEQHSSSNKSQKLSVIYSASQKSQQMKTPKLISQEASSKSSLQSNSSLKKTPLKQFNKQNISFSESDKNLNHKSFSDVKDYKVVQNLEILLGQMQKLPASPMLTAINQHLQLFYNSTLNSLHYHQNKFNELHRKYQKIMQQNQLYVNAIQFMKDHMNELIKNQQQLLTANIELAKKLQKKQHQIKKIDQLTKQNQYFKYLIIAANKKYQELSSYKEQRLDLLTKSISLQNTSKQLSAIQELMIKIHRGKQINFKQLMSQFSQQTSKNSDIQINKDTKHKKVFLKKKQDEIKEKQKQKEQRREKQKMKQDKFDVNQSYRKYLFKT